MASKRLVEFRSSASVNRPKKKWLKSPGFLENKGFSGFKTLIRANQGHSIPVDVELELGVGANTPVIIKYPFWRMTAKNPKAVYACINKGEAMCPREIKNQSICIDGDIGNVVKQIKEL